MVQIPLRSVLGALTVGAVALLGPADAGAGGEEEMCRVVDVDFTPTDELQIVIWLEDSAGNYVETLFVTDLTGRRGLGNRPGRMDFNSAWKWPYGRREGVFPVWAHRHGLTWPLVMFQNEDGLGATEEDDLSHAPDESSTESFYCRPFREGEAGWDTETCASTVFTDKGKLAPDRDSLYPPRVDMPYDLHKDDPAVETFAELNPFDAVSQATPIGGARYRLSWPIPIDLLEGDYVVWVEVSKESDHNDTYNPTSYPEPTGILYAMYGAPYRGQPSVVYSVPFQIGPSLSVGSADTYDGYGDPDGIDGDIRVPDPTIDDDVPGSGAQRLLTTIDGGDSYRVLVEARLEFDESAPAAPDEGRVIETTSAGATVSFVEPGDDGTIGEVEGYEIRYRAGTEMDDNNFLDSSPVASAIQPDESGVVQLVTLEGLLPQTNYFIGVRAFDDCKNYGPLLVIPVTTAERETGEVDACFVATAAYGSLMANDVEALREFRDSALRNNVVGEMLVEAYYTFGPTLAGLIDDSEELRGLARTALDPVVGWVRERWQADAVADRDGKDWWGD